MKISKTHHIRKEGPGAGKIRLNPDQRIENTVNAMFYPIVSYAGQESSYPPDLKRDMPLIRMMHNAENPEEFREKAHDFEAMGYLNTATMAGPASQDWTEIYTYLMNKYLKYKKIPNPPKPLVTKLSSHQEEMLNDLKIWIRKQQKEALSKRRNK